MAYQLLRSLCRNGRAIHNMASKPRINVDVVSDVIWPWCWVGKRKMELAMESLKDKFDFRVRWEPFFLKPDTPPEGIPKPAAYTDPNNPRYGC